jgi:hypothetical protein
VVSALETMTNWTLAGSDWLEKLYDRMKAVLLARDILHADETRLQLLKEDGRAAQTNSTMWLYRSGRDGQPIALLEYQRTRAGAHPTAFHNGFAGYLHVDGYAAYEGLHGVTLVGCFAHARRKFFDAINLLPPGSRQKRTAPQVIGLAFCNKLFAIEHDLHDVTAEGRHAGREAALAPLLLF